MAGAWDVVGEANAPAGWEATRETPPPRSTAGQVGHSIGLGVRNVAEGIIGPAYDLAAKPFQAAGLPVRSFSDNLTALGLPQAETPFERGASAVIEPVAGTLTGQGVGRAMAGAASPVARTVGRALTEQPGTQAVAAGTGGAVTEATGDPRLGLAAGMVTPLATSGIGAAARGVERAAIGGNISQADASLGRIAKDKYGIPINAGDMTDNSIMRTGLDQAGKLPFSGARASNDAKQSAWQGAIAKEMGEPDATAFQPHVMQRTAERIGKTFEDAAAHTNIPPEHTGWLNDELDALSSRADKVLLAGETAPIKNQIKELKELIEKNDGHISGEVYQRLTRTGSDLSLLEKRQDNVGDFAGLVRDALDDAFARSASPERQEALQQARYQYRVMRTVDQLAAGSRNGNISPDAFMQKVLTASRRFDPPTAGMAYTGGGNIGELARIGKLMRAAPQTGTADRMLVNLGTGVGLVGLGNITPTGAALTAGTLAANRAAGSYLRSGATADRLIDSIIGPQFTPRPNPLLQGLQTSGVAGLENEYQNQLMRQR
jgi:hypothetical protein